MESIAVCIKCGDTHFINGSCLKCGNRATYNITEQKPTSNDSQVRTSLKGSVMLETKISELAFVPRFKMNHRIKTYDGLYPKTVKTKASAK